MPCRSSSSGRWCWRRSCRGASSTCFGSRWRASASWCLLGSGGAGGPIDWIGILFALGAALSWAIYILSGKAAGDALGNVVASVSLGIAALILLPAGAASAGTTLLNPAILPLAVLVAIVSATIPFWLELYAMPRLPTRTFSVLMSLEPVFAVLFGLVMLGERLSLVQTVGVALVIGSSIGSVLTIRRAKPLRVANRWTSDQTRCA